MIRMSAQLWIGFLLIVCSGGCTSLPLTKHVVLISFDGLRPDAITALGKKKASAFYQMIKEGSSTLNARTDHDYSVTLPNHTCMITGYPVLGEKGHQVTENGLTNKTVHDSAGRPVGNVFRVLKANHMRSAMIASKLKFDIYAKSFPINTVFVTDGRDDKVNKIFEKLVKDGLPNFVFIHFSNPDRTGHKEGWTTALNSSYMKQVEILNGYLKKILDEIKSRKYLKNSTVVIVTTDHGGEGSDHSDHTKSVNYTIPFIIWGKAVAKGEDLYKINSDRRIDPLDQRISYDQPGQPIRNGDAANLAVSLLGFSSIEGSTIGFDKPLKINKDQN